MMTPNAWQLALLVPASFAGGVLLGVVYFRAVRMTADLIVSGQKPLIALGLTLGRFALLGAGFFLAVQAGWVAVLAVLAGVLAGRRLVLRPIRENRA